MGTILLASGYFSCRVGVLQHHWPTGSDAHDYNCAGDDSFVETIIKFGLV